MAGFTEQWIANLRIAFNGPAWKAIEGAFAKVVGDDSASWGTQANLEHLPQYAGDAASVVLTSHERTIDQGPSETTASLAGRLVGAVPTRQLSGTPLGLLVALWWQGFPTSTIVTQNGWAFALSGAPDPITPANQLVLTQLGGCPFVAGGPTLPAGLTAGQVPWFDFDCTSRDANGDQFTSRFAVLWPDGGNQPATTTDALARARNAVAQWKPTKATNVGFFCQRFTGITGHMWDWPTNGLVTWSDWGSTYLWGGSAVDSFAP